MDRRGSNLMVYHEHITTNVVSTPFLSIFSESSLNIKFDKRWIPFVRNWIFNFTVEQ
jgi:hypothetical protein